MSQYLCKYLSKYAEPDIAQLGSKLIEAMANLQFNHVVVIPAYKESPAFIQRFLASNLAQQTNLMIVVINQPNNDVDVTPQADLYHAIVTSGSVVFSSNGCTFIKPDHNNCYIVVIDKFSTPLPKEQGVGLARKIGTDLALYLHRHNKIQADWIHSTDADAHLPHDYFSAAQALSTQSNNKKLVGLNYNFTHSTVDAEIHHANQQYETALRYYMAGLAYAQSSYAFFTIGSIIAFKAEAYAKVRGFPKRSAGEDFYLLNKLAKLGSIAFLESTVVTLDARTSDRVPFGTGPAVSQILQLKQDNQAYCYYHPQVFTELKTCLLHFTTLWEYRFTIEEWLSNLSPESQHALHDIKLTSFIEKQSHNNQVQFNKQINVWFDAFKTLKFIHSLREQKNADIPLEHGLTLAPFI